MQPAFIVWWRNGTTVRSEAEGEVDSRGQKKARRNSIEWCGVRLQANTVA